MSNKEHFIWLMFYGMHEFNLTRQEIMLMRYGELVDLVSCLSVYNGSARSIDGLQSHHITNYDEAVRVR